MKELILSCCLLIISAPLCFGSDQNLLQRVDQLEKQLGGLESLVAKILEQELVDHYGLIRRCPMPSLDHGVVRCDKEDRVPGTKCSAKCAPGYTPATSAVTCLKGGKAWSQELRCNVDTPLLVVSGGSESPSVEVISFHNSSGCDLKIPDIPRMKDGEVRLMNNMFYFPGSPFQLLVCNGLAQSSPASCDSWTLGDSKWKYHSNPHTDQMGSLNYPGGFNFNEKMYNLERSGRYGASSFSWDGDHYIVGGMINKGNDHDPTKTTRKYAGPDILDRNKLLWSKGYNTDDMKTKRFLFCIAQYNVTNFVAIGGHSGKIEKSVEVFPWLGNIDLPDMKTSRNGHACTGIDGDAAKILVSGGSDEPHRAGGNSLRTSEMYSSDTGLWEKVGDMIETRFGHALVNIGERVIAIGGKEWNPDVPLKNAEEFDISTKSWRSLGDVMSVPRANFGYALIPHSVIPGCTIN